MGPEKRAHGSGTYIGPMGPGPTWVRTHLHSCASALWVLTTLWHSQGGVSDTSQLISAKFPGMGPDGSHGSGKASTWVRMGPGDPQTPTRARACSSCTGSSPHWSSMYSTLSPRRNILSSKLYILAVSIYIIYTRDGEIQRYRYSCW